MLIDTLELVDFFDSVIYSIGGRNFIVKYNNGSLRAGITLIPKQSSLRKKKKPRSPNLSLLLAKCFDKRTSEHSATITHVGWHVVVKKKCMCLPILEFHSVKKPKLVVSRALSLKFNEVANRPPKTLYSIVYEPPRTCYKASTGDNHGLKLLDRLNS